MLRRMHPETAVALALMKELRVSFNRLDLTLRARLAKCVVDVDSTEIDFLENHRLLSLLERDNCGNVLADKSLEVVPDFDSRVWRDMS